MGRRVRPPSSTSASTATGPTGPGTTKKTRSLALLASVASLCVVFYEENASTAVPDLDSPTLGLRDREVFLDRVAYCPVQYALRSLTMNRVGILPFLTPAPNAVRRRPPDTSFFRARPDEILPCMLTCGRREWRARRVRTRLLCLSRLWYYVDYVG